MLVKSVDISYNKNWVDESLLLLAHNTKESFGNKKEQEVSDKDEKNKDELPLRWSMNMLRGSTGNEIVDSEVKVSRSYTTRGSKMKFLANPIKKSKTSPMKKKKGHENQGNRGKIRY